MNAPACVFSGRAWRFGDDVSTDAIFPGWMLTKLMGEADLSSAAMSGIDPDFHKKTARGDILVAGANFGCGSSRESAPLCLQHAGISCVVAESFARIFYRNCVNLGLRPLVCAQAGAIETGHQLEWDPTSGALRNKTTGAVLTAQGPRGIAGHILERGGLMAYIREKGWRL